MRWFRYAAAVALVTAMAIVTGCSAAISEETLETARTASITMRTNTGTQQEKITLPLTSTQTGMAGIWLQGTNMTPYISAQATDSGSITCRITIMGVVVSENTSSGYGSIATCAP